MSFLSSPLNYLGVDFDSHSVKVVELKNEKGRPKLLTYGYFDHEVDYEPNKNQDNLREIANLIKATVKKAGVTTKTAIAALPAFSVFSSVITLPVMSKKELASAISWEAKKVVPLSLEEMSLHWDIIEEKSGGGEEKTETPSLTSKIAPAGSLAKVSPQEAIAHYARFLKIARPAESKKSLKVLLTAAPNNLVKKYLDIFKAADLNLLSLDTETFALIRSLIGLDKSAIMLVSLKFLVSNISVIEQGIPWLNRSVNVGGLTITRAIANSLNINLKRAEQFKYDLGLGGFGSGNQGIPQTVESALQPIIDEIKYSLNLYKNQGGPKVEKIILTGGSALLANLPDYLSKILNIRVFLGDPWARVIYPEELKPVLAEIGPRFSVAVGLAMKEIV